MPSLGAWGVLGDTLTGGANEYLKARQELPFLQDKLADVEQRKQLRPIELEQARQELAYRRALTQKNAYGADAPAFHSLKDGRYLLVWKPSARYPEGHIETRGEALPGSGDPSKQAGEQALKAMAELVGKPLTQFTYEDFRRPDVRNLMDVVNKRADVVGVPQWGPLDRGEVRQSLTPQAPGEHWQHSLAQLGPPPNTPTFQQGFNTFLTGFQQNKLTTSEALQAMFTQEFRQLATENPELALAYKRAYITRYQQPLPAGVP